VLFSGRDDFSVADLSGFILVDSDAHQLGTINRDEIKQVAHSEGYSAVRILTEGDVHTTNINPNRVNVVYVRESGKITKIWRG
jgi:Peptidase inhibitor I78 family